MNLKRCPFCGSKSEIRSGSLKDHYIIECSNPECVTNNQYDDIEQLVKEWNTYPEVTL